MASRSLNGYGALAAVVDQRAANLLDDALSEVLRRARDWLQRDGIGVAREISLDTH